MIKVIVLGGHVQALGIVRAVANQVDKCEIWDKTRYSLAKKSRYADAFRYIDHFDEQTVITRLLREDTTGTEIIVFPNDEPCVRMLSEHYQTLRSHGIYPAVEEWDTAMQFYDKARTYQLAEQAGIPYPRTLYLDGEPIVPQDIEYPVIVKPTVMQPFYQVHGKKAIRCGTEAQLRQTLRNVCNRKGSASDYQLMIQEVIPGSARHLYSFAGIRLDDGELFSTITVRRKRQIPADFGTGTFVETAEVPELGDLGMRLLAAARYNGIFEIEFKYDYRDRQYKLLEVNPRLWKWHALASAVGLNIAGIFTDHVLGKNDVPNMNIPSDGTEGKWRDSVSDMAIGVQQMVSLHLSPGEFYRDWSAEHVNSVWSPQDPRPFFYMLWILPFLIRGGRTRV